MNNTPQNKPHNTPENAQGRDQDHDTPEDAQATDPAFSDLPYDMHDGYDRPAPEHKADAESAEGRARDNDASQQDTQAYIEKINALQAELDEAKDQMLRAVAELENTRKRLLRDREDVRKYAVADFAKDLLDFSDNFRRALDAIPSDLGETDTVVKNIVSGVEAMEKELMKTFSRHGIQKIEPEEKIFDPNVHEVMFEGPSGGKPPGTIIQVIEPGYMLHDRLLRPARVGVAKDDGQPQTHQIDTEA